MPFAESVALNEARPGCLLFLIDQSTTMHEPLAGTQLAKTEAIAETVSQLLGYLAGRMGGRQLQDLAILGYADSVVPIGPDGFTPIAMTPPRLPASSPGGSTALTAALDRAGELLSPWVDAHPSSPPPIVVNITDGPPTDGNPTIMAGRLTDLKTAAGPTRLYHAHVARPDAAAPLVFPATGDPLPDSLAQLLAGTASVLPPEAVDQATHQGFTLSSGSRGLGYALDRAWLRAFLQALTTLPIEPAR